MAIFERKRYPHNRLIQLIAQSSMSWGELVLRHPFYADILKVAGGDRSIKERLGGPDVRANIKRTVGVLHDALGDDIVMQLAAKSAVNLIIESQQVLTQHSNDLRTPRKDLQTSLLVNILAAKVSSQVKCGHDEEMLKGIIQEHLKDLVIPDVYKEELTEKICKVITEKKKRPVMCQA